MVGFFSGSGAKQLKVFSNAGSSSKEARNAAWCSPSGCLAASLARRSASAPRIWNRAAVPPLQRCSTALCSEKPVTARAAATRPSSEQGKAAAPRMSSGTHCGGATAAYQTAWRIGGRVRHGPAVVAGDQDAAEEEPPPPAGKKPGERLHVRGVHRVQEPRLQAL